MTKNFTLVRRDRQLVAVKVGSPAASSLIPTIEIDALDTRGADEFVDVLFHFRKAGPKEAEKAEETVRPLLGPLGRVIVVPNAWDLRVIDIAGNVRRIRDVVKHLEASQGDVVKRLRVGPQGIDAGGMADEAMGVVNHDVPGTRCHRLRACHPPQSEARPNRHGRSPRSKKFAAHQRNRHSWPDGL